MPVDETLARYSDLTYASALAVYVLALLLHAAEHAFGRQALVRERRELVRAAGAGAGPPGTETPRPALPDKPERLARMGLAVTVLAVGLHGASLVLRGLATSRVPWGNMYEYLSAVCLAAVVTWLLVQQRHPVRRLAPYVLLPTVVLLFLAGTALYAEAAPLIPALRSYWIVIHVSAAVIASGVFLVSGVASLLYLLRTSPRMSGGPSPLPAADVLDRLAYRTTVFAFPLLTFAVVAGAIWAEAAWGRYWGWDPKETCALIAWVVYAAYLHARATAGWRGRGAAWINVAGFAVTLFNLFFVNIVVAGLHSYAGV
jgi:cytochrome c-type biogenesis protein CcsB